MLGSLFIAVAYVIADAQDPSGTHAVRRWCSCGLRFVELQYPCDAPVVYRWCGGTTGTTAWSWDGQTELDWSWDVGLGIWTLGRQGSGYQKSATRPLCPPINHSPIPGEPCNNTDQGELQCSYQKSKFPVHRLPVRPSEDEYCCCGRCLDTLSFSCERTTNSTDTGLWQLKKPTLDCPQVCHPCNVPGTPGCEGGYQNYVRSHQYASQPI